MLEPDGQCFRITTKKEPVMLAENLAQALSGSVARYIPHAFVMDGNQVHLIQTAKETYAAVELANLRIKCPWKMEKKEMVPYFDGSAEENPVMTIDWPVPDSFRMFFVSRIYNGVQTRKDKANWLLMEFTEKREFYLLPVANVFEDGSICMGEFIGTPAEFSLQAGLKLAYDQFRTSPWNADLFAGKAERCWGLISFTAAGDKFIAKQYGKAHVLKHLTRNETAITNLVRGIYA